MTTLTIVQQACLRVGLPQPNAVVTSTDSQVLQLLALLNQEGQALAERYPWQALINEATHTSLATESQGLITSIATNGFKYILNDTIWNRTEQRPIYGSVSPEEWQMLKASPVTGPYEQFRLRGGYLIINPTPTAGQTWAFEYVSKNWCTDSGGSTYRDAFAADADVALLDETILMLGLIWRWKMYKGLEYAEHFRDYETQVANAMARDKVAPVLSMDGSVRTKLHGTLIPVGNWDL